MAQSPADQLQKGIYAQETAGDIDGAIKIFRQVANSPNKTIAEQEIPRERLHFPVRAPAIAGSQHAQHQLILRLVICAVGARC